MDDPPVYGDRYEPLERLGQDVLFEEYRARDRESNRIVRLRLLRSDLAESPAFVGDLRRELGSVFSLNPPASVRLLDIGESSPPHRLFVVEEYVRGVDLATHLSRSGPMDWLTAVTSMVPIVETLVYALDRGVVHGNLLDSRILVGPGAKMLVRGYGESSAIVQAVRIRSGDRSRAGNRPPELSDAQVATQPLQDVWYAGLVLFAMLCGRLPESGAAAPTMPGDFGFSDPRSIDPRIPEAIAGIVSKCLAVDTTVRYQNARSLLADLRQVVRDASSGQSLDWNPMQRPNPGIGPGLGVHGSTGSRPRVMPGSGVREDPMESNGSSQGTVSSRGFPWLTAAMVLSGFLLVGSCAMVFFWVRPYLMPATVVVVPNLVGMSESDADRLAKDRGLKLEVVDRQFRDDPPAGQVYQMRERPGEKILPGQPLAVWVSKGPEMVDVPDVARMGLDKARQVLESAGLKVGGVTRVWDFTEPAGNVVDQGGLAGQRKVRGTGIDLTVSKGPEPEPDPSPAPEPDSDPVPASPPDGGAGAPDPGPEQAAGQRTYLVNYKVPADDRSHRIRVDVEDEEGLHTAYDQVEEAGKSLKIEVTFVGAKVTIRLYDNDVLKATSQ